MLNLNLDTTIRWLIEGDQDTAKHIAAVATDKLADCGLKSDASKALRSVPVHTGRKNPLAGQKKGGLDWDTGAVVNWINSIPAALPDKEDPSFGDVQSAFDNLVLVQATAAARGG